MRGNPVLYPVAQMPAGEKAEGFKLQDKFTDGGIGGGAKVPLQLFGGKFLHAVGGEDEGP